MSEKLIREVAARFGLTVEKRITTGTDKAHFATFELTGPGLGLIGAYATLRDHAPPFSNLRIVDNPEHPDHGKQYVEIQSVWCD